MNKKYRIKLKSNRIVGPFEVGQVAELFQKGHVKGNEEAQVFPSGEWKSAQEYPELKRLFLDLLEGNIKSEDLKSEENATIAKISISKIKEKEKKQATDKKNVDKAEKLKKLEDKAKKEAFEEFKFEKKTQVAFNYKELQETEENDENSNEVISAKKDEPAESDSDVEKTRILQRPTPLDDIDKTRVVTPLPKLNENEESLSDLVEEDEDELEEEVEAVPEVDVSESTQFFDASSLLPKVVDDEAEVENELRKIREDEENEKAAKKELTQKEKTKILDLEKINESKNKKMKPIVLIAFLAILGFLFLDDDDGPKPIQPIVPIIDFPVTEEVVDEAASEQLLKKGVKASFSEYYLSKLKAAKYFKASLQKKFKGNEALGYLILTYAELYPNSQDKRKASETLFKLIQIGKYKALTDINIVMGTAIFYSNNKKSVSAIRTIENYLRLGKPTIKLFSVYLNILIEAGELIKARKVLTKLESLPPEQKSLLTYLGISRFYRLDEQFDKGLEVIREGITFREKRKQKVPVPFFLELSLYLFRDLQNAENARTNKSFIKLGKVLSLIEILRAEECPVYFASFLEYSGLVSAIMGRSKKAAALFKIALKLNESEELRSKLAALELGGSQLEESLILESKIKDLMEKSKKSRKENKWTQAFSYAIEASDLSDNYIPSQLLLADIQVQRGYFESAISTLRKLKEYNQKSPRIAFSLINALIEARKFDQAQTEIGFLGNTQMAVLSEFASLQAKYYKRLKRPNETANWYIEAINQNPINDYDLYEFADFFLKGRRYKKAKEYINKAITLDPLNIKYHSLYSNILFELQGAEIAIGYMRNLLTKNPDDPKILGEIAIYYYRNGQMSEFEDVKEKVEKLNSKDPSFYKFLIKSAKLEGNYEAVIKNSELLLQIEPGNIKVRMDKGENEFKAGKYAQAISSFESILTRLTSYPTANYQMAKVYIALKNYKKAVEKGKLEIAANPKIYHGYYVTGEAQRKMGQYKKAIKNLEQAITRDGNSVESMLALGWIKVKQNFMEQAREFYLRAKQKAPDNPEIRKQLGNIFRATGQRLLACEEYKTYLNLNPAALDRRKIERLKGLLCN